jgi:hypothetical protein
MQFKWFCALTSLFLLLGSADAQQTPAPQKSLAATLGVYVFPSDGQSSAQQSKDEGTCYQWAVNDTGSDPFEVQKQEAAAKEGAEQKEEQIASAGAGAGAKGALGGGAAGALIGEVSHGDVGESAAYGAAAGAVIAHRRAKHEKAEAEEQVATQSQQAQQADEAKIAAFKKAFSACLEGKKYTVKY